MRARRSIASAGCQCARQRSTRRAGTPCLPRSPSPERVTPRTHGAPHARGVLPRCALSPRAAHDTYARRAQLKRVVRQGCQGPPAAGLGPRAHPVADTACASCGTAAAPGLSWDRPRVVCIRVGVAKAGLASRWQPPLARRIYLVWRAVVRQPHAREAWTRARLVAGRYMFTNRVHEGRMTQL